MRRAASVWLPTWSTDRLRRRSHSGLPPERPLVVVVAVGNRHVVAGTDRAARGAGITPGQTITQARMLAPDLVVAQAYPEDDAAALARLAIWALRHFSPIVAPAEDGLWLDLAGMDNFGTEAELADKLIDRLVQSGTMARIGVADTPGTAYAVARYGGDRRVIVPPGAQRAAIARLPVAALRLPAETVGLLGRLGIDTVAELEQLPRAPLVMRMGDVVGRRLDQALGNLAEPIAPIAPPEVISCRRAFVEPICTPDHLQRATGMLVAELVSLLEAEGLGARTVDLAFHRVDGMLQVLRIGTARPSRDGKRLARLLVDRLERVDPGFGIEAMTISAPLVEAAQAAQLGTAFAGDEPAAELVGLVDILANRLGPDRLYRLDPVDSDVPERMVRAVAPMSPPAPAVWSTRWPRPGRLLHPPEEIQVINELPDQPPAAFSWRGVRRRVRRADGPERIVGEWWRRDREISAVRDYWQVEADDGERFWLYRSGDGARAETGNLRWFIHGLFG